MLRLLGSTIKTMPRAVADNSQSGKAGAPQQTFQNGRFGPILLKKSQVQDLGKSAQSRVTSTIDCCPPRNPI